MERMTTKLRIAGVMSGTSCDGLDIAILEFDRHSWRPVVEASYPYPQKLREQVLKIQRPGHKGSLLEFERIDRDLGMWYGRTLKGLISKLNKDERPHVIANHGQTVAHFPKDRGGGVTVQLGDPNRIVHETGITTISDFRRGDVAAGGEGAPLVPLFHYLLAEAVSKTPEGVVFLNIGGIANITYLGKRGQILSGDTGTGNVWIDFAASEATRGKQKFDINGKIALAGEIDAKRVDRILKRPYFKRSIPKSTGRDDFSYDEYRKLFKKLKPIDRVSTATALTVESIARVLEKDILRKGHPLRSIAVCGGGAKNLTLLRWLQDRLAGVSVKAVDDYGFESTYIEAQAFAFLGLRSLLGLPLGGPWTGTHKFGAPGRVSPGENWREVAKYLSQMMDTGKATPKKR